MGNAMNDPLSLPLLPLDGQVVLPGMVLPLSLNESEIRAATEAAQAAAPNEGDPVRVLVVPRIDGKYARTGTIALVEQIGRLQNGQPVAVVRGTGRAHIGTGTSGPGAALWVEVSLLEEIVDETAAALSREYKALATTILQQRGAWQVVDSVAGIDDPIALADMAGWAPYLKADQKVELLEDPDVAARLTRLIAWSREHLTELDVNETIRKDVAEGVEKQQREFLLRQQLAAVRKELGELTGKPATEEDDYRAKVEAAPLPDKVREGALAEVDKLERTPDESPEVSWIRTWLDTILALPWDNRSEDSYDLPGARAVLDADHTGLDDVKDRITEYLAVRRRRAERGLGIVGGRRSGAVLVLVGPPGVGKTSLGESVARAMGRRFVRVALGGVRDEAEIRGHRRTYVGAMSGRIARALTEAGSMNPVMLLDEIDKVGSDYRGDPTAALLEVLDPAQNHTFRDHYLEVELDLSDVLFLATANQLESIPGPLLDRMELIRLDGYTEEEKVTIARDHLAPRQIERAGLTADEVSLTDDALRRLAAEYSREAGVRDLERLIARVLRKVAARPDDAEPVAIDAGNLPDYVGRPRHTPESAERTQVPGVATGLAVTGAGGDVLFIEASLAEQETGSSGVTITGQLGEVMKESAQIALSFLRSNGAALGFSAAPLRDRGVHIHVPAGAVPKDGPSAGITMTTALASLLSGRPVRADVAMTGEVSLTGRVLPIGGVKQKLLAAHRAGITTVLIPTRNEPDLDEVPAEVREGLTVHLVSDVRDVLALALESEAAVEIAA